MINNLNKDSLLIISGGRCGECWLNGILVSNDGDLNACIRACYTQKIGYYIYKDTSYLKEEEHSGACLTPKNDWAEFRHQSINIVTLSKSTK